MGNYIFFKKNINYVNLFLLKMYINWRFFFKKNMDENLIV